MKKGEITITELMAFIIGVIVVGVIIWSVIRPTSLSFAEISEIDKCALSTGGDGRCFPTADCGGKDGWDTPIPLGCKDKGFCCQLSDYDAYYGENVALIDFLNPSYSFRLVDTNTYNLVRENVAGDIAPLLEKGLDPNNPFTIGFRPGEGVTYCQLILNEKEFDTVPCLKTDGFISIMTQQGTTDALSQGFNQLSRDNKWQCDRTTGNTCPLDVVIKTGASMDSLTVVASYTIQFARR